MTNYKFTTIKPAARPASFEDELRRDVAKRKAARRKVLDDVRQKRRQAFLRRLTKQQAR